MQNELSPQVGRLKEEPRPKFEGGKCQFDTNTCALPRERVNGWTYVFPTNLPPWFLLVELFCKGVTFEPNYDITLDCPK